MPACPDCHDARMVEAEIGRRTGWFFCSRCSVLFLMLAGVVVRIVR